MNILMLLAEVRPASEQQLRAALAAIEADIDGNPYVTFSRTPSTHFIRWVIVSDDDHGPRLLFVANHDGSIERYVVELVAATTGMDEIWGACEGYGGRDTFLSFVRKHYLKPRGVYVAFPSMTADEVRATIAFRQSIERFLDLPEVASYLDGPELSRLLEQLPTGGSLPTRIARAVDAQAARARGSVRDRGLDVTLYLARWYAQLGQAKTYPPVEGGFDLDRNRQSAQAVQAASVSAGVIQNEMTTITEIRPERMPRLRFALAGTTVLARFGWPPGEFADVGTLHWFAWAILDGGKRLLFISTFDGSWQNYMQDFVNKLVWGLDALYANTYGYPAAGMRDGAAFTDFIQSHQFPRQVLYSAYPEWSVMNLINDRAILQELTSATGAEGAERWLQRL